MVTTDTNLDKKREELVEIGFSDARVAEAMRYFLAARHRVPEPAPVQTNQIHFSSNTSK